MEAQNTDLEIEMDIKKMNNDSVKVTNDDLKKIYYVERGKK